MAEFKRNAPPRFCICRCHMSLGVATIWAGPYSPTGTEGGIVPTDDVIEAAVACRICLNRHTPALLEPKRQPPRTRRIPAPWVDR